MRLLLDGLGKLGRRLATIVTFGVLAGLMVLIFVAFGATVERMPAQPSTGVVRASLTFPGAYDAVLGFIVGFGTLLAVIYGAAIAGSEWTWGTLKNAVARGESRALYVVALFGAIAVVFAVGVVLATLVGIGAALAGASLAGIPTDGAGDGAAVALIPAKMARGWLGIVSSAAIGFAIATFARSQLAGIGAGIATYFGEQFSTIFFPEIVRFLPFNAAEAAADVSTPGGFSGGQGQGLDAGAALPPDVAIGVVLAWLVGALVASAVATQRAEITG